MDLRKSDKTRQDTSIWRLRFSFRRRSRFFLQLLDFMAFFFLLISIWATRLFGFPSWIGIPTFLSLAFRSVPLLSGLSGLKGNCCSVFSSPCFLSSSLRLFVAGWTQKLSKNKNDTSLGRAGYVFYCRVEGNQQIGSFLHRMPFSVSSNFLFSACILPFSTLITSCRGLIFR